MRSAGRVGDLWRRRVLSDSDRPGHTRRHPSTGLKLGLHEKMIGSIQITEVQEQFSVGTIRSDGGTMKRGDRVGVW
jgi:hypothetical protein